MKKPIFKILSGDVYRHDVFFITGCSLADAFKKLKRYEIKPVSFDEEPKGCVIQMDEDTSKYIRGTVLFVWIKDRKDFYTLLHEVSHLCVKVFELSNMEINGYTTEAFAFYQEFWFKKLWRIMSSK